MPYQKNFKISAEVEGCYWSRIYSGTDAGASVEAMDLMNEMLLRYFKDNRITDSDEQDEIISRAINSVEYDETQPLCMYAVLADDDEDPVLGVYMDPADAEEAILAECEAEIYELMMTSCPLDTIGCEEWDWHSDYYWLLKDYGSSFRISTTPVYGVDYLD